MNERIKDLMDQAYDSYVDPIDGQEAFRFSREKFAELIIRECANACLKATTEDSPVHLVSVAYADNVKKHFGVE